jgi:hypothetical protein
MWHVCNTLVWEWYKVQLPNTAQVFVVLLLDALVVTWTTIRLSPIDDRRYWTAGVRHRLQWETGPQMLSNTAYSNRLDRKCFWGKHRLQLTSDGDTTHTFEMLMQSSAIAMKRNCESSKE